MTHNTNARHLARLQPGQSLTSSDDTVTYTITKPGLWFTITKRYSSGDFMQVKTYIANNVLDEMTRFEVWEVVG